MHVLKKITSLFRACDIKCPASLLFVFGVLIKITIKLQRKEDKRSI